MIRRAQRYEHATLTALSFRSKAFWAYPEYFFSVWQKELTISPSYIEQNRVYVVEEAQVVEAYYSLVEISEPLVMEDILLEAGIWLDHMFVLPEKIHNGLGQQMFEHCLRHLKEVECHCLKILADPHARGFYERMGCTYIADVPSSIPGRTIPYLEYSLSRTRTTG